MQKYPSFIHRPALGWTVTERTSPFMMTNRKCIRNLLLLVYQLVFVGQSAATRYIRQSCRLWRNMGIRLLWCLLEKPGRLPLWKSVESRQTQGSLPTRKRWPDANDMHRAIGALCRNVPASRRRVPYIILRCRKEVRRESSP